MKIQPQLFRQKKHNYGWNIVSVLILSVVSTLQSNQSIILIWQFTIYKRVPRGELKRYTWSSYCFLILWPPLGRPQAETQSRTNVIDVNTYHLDHLQGTELLPCDWVACLQPPQAPAYTHLRHTGWWGFKKLLESEMIHICQVWRPHPIRRECEFCLWEGDGFWGGLPSNLLWSDMPG